MKEALSKLIVQTGKLRANYNGKHIEEEKQVLERFLDSEQYFRYN
ncbi:MAG TPA: hypothetical protein VH351_05835 [Bryobacteraceae bacterium]|jgi:hypothetical protein|nr:hypothetical protein [Bryobacteraceae bacterium]